MPNVVDASAVPKSTRGRVSKYPYAEWFAAVAKLGVGKVLELTQGEDFDCAPASLRNLLQKAFTLHGVAGTIGTRIGEEKLYLKVKGNANAAEAPAAAASKKAAKSGGKKGSAKGKRKGD